MKRTFNADFVIMKRSKTLTDLSILMEPIKTGNDRQPKSLKRSKTVFELFVSVNPTRNEQSAFKETGVTERCQDILESGSHSLRVSSAFGITFKEKGMGFEVEPSCSAEGIAIFTNNTDRNRLQSKPIEDHSDGYPEMPKGKLSVIKSVL